MEMTPGDEKQEQLDYQPVGKRKARSAFLSPEEWERKKAEQRAFDELSIPSADPTQQLMEIAEELMEGLGGLAPQPSATDSLADECGICGREFIESDPPPGMVERICPGCLCLEE